MSNYREYRRPEVAVIGAGAAGVAAATECSLIGFRTILLDENQEIGGRYAGVNPAQPPKKFGFRKGNLKHHRFTGSAASAREHLAATVEFSDAVVELHSRVTSARFDKDQAKWLLNVENTLNGQQSELTADVIIIATGTGTVDKIYDLHNREFDLPHAHLHQGVEPIGLPNILVVDSPEPEMTGLFSYPLDVIEAKADHAQRYVRQLEVAGPGQLTVNRSYWRAAIPVRRKTIADLREIPAKSHDFTALTQKNSTKKEGKKA